MAPYEHPPLDEDCIRLLQLLPDPDPHNPANPIKCRVSQHPVLTSPSTHHFEALSYAWGSDQKPNVVCINDCEYAIGANLHAALLHLRDRFLDRYLWIDAICINQDNTDEKGHQVQNMTRIYSKATRVIVWLGEATRGFWEEDESARAMERIRLLAKGRSAEWETQADSGSIIKLLQRPWFQRIWVLQEVAAARHVVIKCGHAEIDGYAFCLGLDRLRCLYEKHHRDLRGLISSLTYLIKDSIFRPRYQVEYGAARDLDSEGSRFSLSIRPLGELVDMFHTRKATNQLDKVYALLGMASDDPSRWGLMADYDASWKDVFQKLISFSISTLMISIETWDGKNVALMKCKGRVLRRVSWYDMVDVEGNELVPQGAHDSEALRLHASVAGKIREGDIICLLQAAMRPMVVRLHGDYASVITATMPSASDYSHVHDRPYNWDGLLWAERLRDITDFPNTFFLAWDWTDLSTQPRQHVTQVDNYQESQSEGADDKWQLDDFLNFHQIPATKPERPHTPTVESTIYFDRLQRIWDMGLVLLSLKQLPEALNKVSEVVGVFDMILTYDARKKSSGHGGSEPEGVEYELEATDHGENEDVGTNQEGNEHGKNECEKTEHLGSGCGGNEHGGSGDGGNEHERMGNKASEHQGSEEVHVEGVDKDEDDKTSEGSNRSEQSERVEESEENQERTAELGFISAFLDTNGGFNAQAQQLVLTSAVLDGREALVRHLAQDRGVGVNGLDESEENHMQFPMPLVMAIYNDQMHMVRLLLELGASAHRPLGVPLAVAAGRGNKGIVQVLLESGATANHQDYRRRTPLHHLAMSWDRESLIMLRYSRWDMNEEYNEPELPLDRATLDSHDRVEIAQMLLDHGVDLNAKDFFGWTALTQAAFSGLEHLVGFLIEKGADKESYPAALRAASRGGHQEIVDLLRARGAEHPDEA